MSPKQINSFDDKDFSAESWRVCNLVPNGKKVLYYQPKEKGAIDFLRKSKGCEVSVLAKSVSVESFCDNGVRFVLGDITKQSSHFNDKEFDFMIVDSSILAYKDVPLTLAMCARIARYVVVGVKNVATLKNRIQFLLTGKFSDSSEPNAEKWYEDSEYRRCSIGEFMEMCRDSGIMIERSCYYHNNVVQSLYDVRRMPSLFADKAYYLISDVSPFAIKRYGI